MSSKQSKDQKNVRVIYVKDTEKSILGFDSFEDATVAAEKIRGSKEAASEQIRVRVLRRNRTDKFDVLVKSRREVESKVTE